jgi:hypothetical protein
MDETGRLPPIVGYGMRLSLQQMSEVFGRENLVSGRSTDQFDLRF